MSCEIRVGIDSGDIRGGDARAIQLALDAAAFKGGGTVRVAAGEYVFEGPLRLRSNVTLIGEAGRTIFRHGPVVCSPLAVDADTGQRQFTPVDPDRFAVGRGVIFRCEGKDNAMATMPLTIIGRAGDAWLLNDYVTADWIAERRGMAVTYYPLLHGCEVEKACVKDVVLDGAPDSLDGIDVPGWGPLWGGGLYLRYGLNCRFDGVEARNICGDGLRWGRSRHTTLTNCCVHDNTHYGMHPGSHSPHSIVRDSRIHDNGSDGLYLCWGVHDGEFTGNEIFRNGYRIHRNGISIGHKDTDNLIADNHVYDNAKHGICFRIKTAANGAHRNRLVGNLIENNGRPAGEIPADLAADPRNEVQCCGVFIRGVTRDLVFERNVIRETRPEGEQRQHNAFFLDKGVSGVKLIDNEISEHPGGKIADASADASNDLQGLA